MKKLTIVIPVFNEEKGIEDSIHRMFSNLKKLNLNPEVLCVDDSIDKTYEILRRLEKTYNDLKVIHRTQRSGVGSAIRLGIEKAKGESIIVFMADAPEDVKYFPSIIKKLEEGHDLVQTSRFFKECKMVGYPFKKRIFNWLCNNSIKVAFFESKLKDFSSLFKAFNKKKINGLKLSADEFDLGLEIVLKSIRKNYSIVEVPVNWVEREKGESKLKLSRYAKYYFTRTLKIWLTYWG